MDFYVETEALQRAVRILSVTAKLNAKDPSGLVFIEAKDGGGVQFVSSNSSTSLTYALNSDKVLIKTPGCVVVEYGRLKSFVSAFPIWGNGAGVKDFHFTQKDQKLIVSASNIIANNKVSNARIRLNEYDLYSVRQPMPFEKVSFVIDAEILAEAVNKVLYAINPSDSRPFIQGMYLSFDSKQIYFAGTNGKLISEYCFKNESGLEDGGFLFKYDFVAGLRRLAVEGGEKVEFEVDDRLVKARTGGLIFYGRPIIGHQFPDYKTPLKSFKNVVAINKEALDVSSLLDFLNPDDNFRLTFEFKGGDLHLYSDAGHLVSEKVVDEAQNFVIDLNGLFLKSTIEAIKDQKILVKFTDERSPIIFDSANFENQKGLITPLRRR